MPVQNSFIGQCLASKSHRSTHAVYMQTHVLGAVLVHSKFRPSVAFLQCYSPRLSNCVDLLDSVAYSWYNLFNSTILPSPATLRSWERHPRTPWCMIPATLKTVCKTCRWYTRGWSAARKASMTTWTPREMPSLGSSSFLMMSCSPSWAAMSAPVSRNTWSRYVHN